MKKKSSKAIMATILIALFVLPIALRPEAANSYEQTPKFSNEELAQILAPIALYPDSLLSQILIAASYPFEMAEAERWIAKNPYLKDEQLDDALYSKDWDVSVLSLCYYPNVLTMMVENLTWTAKIGDAFVHQQQDVMDTIQELRAMARDQGNLATTNEQKMIIEEKIIRIEPAYYNYLHVPVYDPFVIYGTWHCPKFPPFRLFYPGISVVGPRIVFSPGMSMGFGVIGWSVFDWPSHNVVILNIDRTRRFNKNYHVYHSPKRHTHWKPNHQKRTGHLPPAKKSHTFRSPVRKQHQKALVPKVPQKPLAPPRLNKKGRHPTSDSKITGKHSTQAEARPHIRDRNKPHNKIKPAQPKHRLTDKGKQTMKDRRVPNKVNAAPRAPHSKKNGVTTILNGADRRHFNHYSHYSAGKGGEGRHRVNNHGFTGRGRSEEKYRR